MTTREPKNEEGLTKRRTLERSKRVTRRRAERKRERERGVGMSDEEQGEWLPSIPNTDTDNASLLGQSPQSTEDVPLPRPPPHTQPRRVRCCDCLAFWLEPVFVRLVFILYALSACALISADYWITRDIPVWVKVLLGLLAFPFGFICCMEMRGTHETARRNNNNVVS